ncbi:hypothetical protein MNBD_ALPHA06-1764 [hydrothermal vent metagenome]|uniref:DUF4177 domain-containing protein n=1 Tax=hydrothermal vent metagenome TaxID=652676 RepID=A0A3B0RY80_9ZZZZ
MKIKWSYKVEDVTPPLFSGSKTRNKIIEETLNRRGMEGWELVKTNASSDGMSVTIYLKRPS